MYDNLGKEKEISFVSAPTENLQARYITEWLRKDGRYKDGTHTAIVLCDEHLLQTVIHCIPSEVGTLNITTGYPLQQTPIASMVTQLLILQTEGYSVQEQGYRLHHVSRVLRHPYGKYLIPNVSGVLEQLSKDHRFYIPPRAGTLLEYHPSDRQHLPALADWLTRNIRLIGVNGAADKDPLFEESVFRMFTLLTRLSDLMAGGDLEADKVVFRRLLTQLVSSTSIPFHGEPARGVQVMGVLETRNLDFDHVLVLSCNEGNMPKGVDDSSFIPHLIRKAYDLTTIDNKVSIYSYYFYSLIQRAKDITFLYNNSTQGSRTGEMSRFMLQLMVEWNHPIHRMTLQAGQVPRRCEAKAVTKDEAVLNKLDEISYFSPTAINTYISCHLKYYFKYIAEINENEETGIDDVDNRMFGNIFHSAAQLMYEKLLPKEVITDKNIDYVLKTGKSAQPFTADGIKSTMDDVVDEAFATELFHQQPGSRRHPRLNGLQLINREVIKKYLYQLLRIDRRTAPLRVIGHEFNVKRTLLINVNGAEKQIETGGRIDRLDEVFVGTEKARLRVVDYKTGSKTAEPLKNVEAVFDPKNIEKKSDYTMQAMLYSLIESRYDILHNPGHRPVSPALLFIQHSGGEDYTPVIIMDGEEMTDVTLYEKDFLRKLTETLEEIGGFTRKYEGTDDDFAYSRRMSRFDGFWGGYYDPWFMGRASVYAGWGWPSPYYYSGWYDTWYDPWYYGYYSGYPYYGYGYYYGGYPYYRGYPYYYGYAGYGWYGPWRGYYGWGYPYYGYRRGGYYAYGGHTGTANHWGRSNGSYRGSVERGGSYGNFSGYRGSTGTMSQGNAGQFGGNSVPDRSNIGQFGGSRQSYGNQGTRSYSAPNSSYSPPSNSSFGGATRSTFGGGSFGGSRAGGGSFGGTRNGGGFGGHR